MNKLQKEIDDIDLELFRLALRASRLSSRAQGSKINDLSRAISSARSISYSLLPEHRQKELVQ